jgi:hypothetical protein
MLSSGCCCCTGSQVYEPTASVLWDETTWLDNDHYLEYSAVLNKGTTLNIDVSANSGIDVMVMDSSGFTDYKDAVSSFSGGEWNSYISQKSIMKKSFTFTVPSTDRYYIIIDNTDSLEGGAYANKGLSVSLKVTY